MPHNASQPGGCELGPRPIDLHLAGLRDLGAEITESGGIIRCRCEKLQGRRIVLGFPSVGATENLMLAACAAEGDTTIENAACEPEITEVQNFLNHCGAKIRGGGTSTVHITGRPAFHGGTWRVMPDRIVTATYLCACGCAGGEVYLRGGREDHLAAVTEVLRRAGCMLREDAAGLRCVCKERLCAVPTVRTAPYPGFPTDAQAVLMAALCKGKGTTVFEENIFENRYRHVDELRRLGADIRVSGRAAVISGVERLAGANVAATDLRGGAALCAAALGADGVSRIGEIHHIDRGYEDIARDLRALGAHIFRREE